MSKIKPTLDQLLSLAGGYDLTRALQIAVTIGLFESLKSGPKSSESIARQIMASHRGTWLLLNVMTGIGLLKKSQNRYALTALSKKYLLKSSPTSYATMIEFMESGYRGFGELEKTIRTGKPLQSRTMFQKEQHLLEKFIGGMHNIATIGHDAEILAKKIPLKNYRSLIDIGGGPGTFSIAFCQKNPKLRATVYDLPGTLRVTRKFLKKYDTTRRVDGYAGDFNKSDFPKRYDVVFLSNIIHSETEVENLRLLKKIFNSLNPGGLLIIRDQLLDSTLTHPAETAAFSLTMLLFAFGRSYGFYEVKQWLQKTSFRNIQRIRNPALMTQDLVLARKPSLL